MLKRSSNGYMKAMRSVALILLTIVLSLTACLAAAAAEEPDGGREDISSYQSRSSQEDALKQKFKKATGLNYDAWRCDDYDYDGTLEAFAEVDLNDDDDRARFYLVTQDSVKKIYEEDYSYLSDVALALPKLGVKLQLLGARHGWRALFAVQNGKAIELFCEGEYPYYIVSVYGGDRLKVSIDKWEDEIAYYYVDTSRWCITPNKPAAVLMKPDFTLPASLRTVSAGAFEGIGMTVVKCPESLLAIYSRAFGNCKKLRQIYIPKSVTVIIDDAFAGCSADLTIFCRSGSTAETFAKKQGIKYAIVK